MKFAFAYWNKRIAPVFDTAAQVHVIETEAGKILKETRENLQQAPPVQRALRLMELKIGTLVCGAISRPLYETIAGYGVRVIPFVAGNLHEVIQALFSGTLERGSFAMPGCRGPRSRRFRGMYCDFQEVNIMNQKARGMGAGRGKKQGQEGEGRGRMSGPFASGPSGYCVCPQCGQTEVHERGVPCIGRKCPKCGAFMARQ